MKHSFLIIAASLIAGLQTHSFAQSPTREPVSWLANAGNKFYMNNSREFYVYVSLQGNEAVKNEKRVPLNISIVLDRSGSMSGDKIAYAKRAASFVVDQLTSNDIVSIVNYDNVVEITSPSEHVRSKEALQSKINALTDRGGTNLTGGMLEGFTQVKSTRKDGYVNRVLLLTDGLANVGITDPTRMKQLVDEKYKQDGIALSTFGVGADYNEDLLTTLAEMGRANYYFIGSPDKIPEIFAKELKGLLSVVAQNAWVNVEFPQNLEVVKVYGYPYEVKNNMLTVRFNDLYANDNKGILLKFRSTGATLPSSLMFDCTLKYIDASDFSSRTSNKKLSIERSDAANVVNDSKDMLVEEMIALFESTEMFDEVLLYVDRGNYEAAKIQAEKAVVYLKEKQQYIRSDKLKKQEETVSVYSKDIEKVKVMREDEKKMYQKSNKSVNYQQKKGKQ